MPSGPHTTELPGWPWPTKKLPCCYPDCGDRRIHHDCQDVPRGHQSVEVHLDAPEDAPVFCSLTCAISDGYMSLAYESPEQQKARQDAWRAKNAKRRSP